MPYTVLTDDDVRRVLPMSAAVDRIESALREHAEGTMVTPPRFRVDVAKGALIFTAGAVEARNLAVKGLLRGNRVLGRGVGRREDGSPEEGTREQLAGLRVEDVPRQPQEWP